MEIFTINAFSFMPLDDYRNTSIFCYLFLILLTIFVGCKVKLTNIKKYYKNTILLILATTFIVYAFYQWQFAYVGAANLSYETVYGFSEMTAYEYNIYYVQAVRVFYQVALMKTLLVGLMLSAVFLFFNTLIKNQD